MNYLFLLGMIICAVGAISLGAYIDFLEEMRNEDGKTTNRRR